MTFGERRGGAKPDPISTPSDLGSAAKLLERTYLHNVNSVKRRPGSARSTATPTNIGDTSSWGAERQKIKVTSLRREVDERMRSCACGSSSHAAAAAVASTSHATYAGGAASSSKDGSSTAGAADAAEVGADGGNPAGVVDGDASSSANVDAIIASALAEVEAGGHGASEAEGKSAGQSTDLTPASSVAVLITSSPTRAPGVAGQLARAQALLSDAIREQERLDAELAEERAASEESAARHKASLREERAKHQRELAFVRSGVDATSAQRQAAAARRDEAAQKALKRAVREAEARISAQAEQAALQAARAHEQELKQMEERYERQIRGLTEKLVSLALESRRLASAGVLPGAPANSSAPPPPALPEGQADLEDEEAEQDGEEMDADRAYAALSAVFEQAKRAAGGPAS